MQQKQIHHIEQIKSPKSLVEAPTVRPCTLADIHCVYAHLREADRLEMELVYGDADVWHLEYSYHLALASWAIHYKGQAIAVFGVSCMSPFAAIGVPWLMGTDALGDIQLPFLRECRKYIAQMHDFFPHLENYVHAENRVSCTWLRWLGFTLEAPALYGIRGALFHHFVKCEDLGCGGVKLALRIRHAPKACTSSP